MSTSNTSLSGKNLKKVFVPNKLLDCLPRSSSLPNERLRWNTNEEIASYLISFDRHDEWLSCTLKTRPKNGSIILYNRKKVRYRNDGYCWKKRKDGKTTREDHMKLKVQGMEVGHTLGCVWQARQRCSSAAPLPAELGRCYSTTCWWPVVKASADMHKERI
uniref:CG-1 domain-containing protein n=1 Tax=Fundulus heteroclitus TaxID=8078 RepID=A0A3Q2PDC2_FUNHE